MYVMIAVAKEGRNPRHLTAVRVIPAALDGTHHLMLDRPEQEGLDYQ